MRELVLLFLKQNRSLFEKANSQLSSEGKDAITLLYQLIGNYLWISTESQTIKRALNLYEKIEQAKDPLTAEYQLATDGD